MGSNYAQFGEPPAQRQLGKFFEPLFVRFAIIGMIENTLSLSLPLIPAQGQN